MKKDRKPVFGGIRNKLFLLILFTVVLIAISFFVVTTYQNSMLSELSADRDCACVAITKGVVKLTKKMMLKLKSAFIRKEA